MSKVREKTLCLQSYPIDKAHCKALADACRVLNDSINRVLIESCGLDDDSFAQIVESLDEVEDLKCITYVQNTIGEKSVTQLAKLFTRKIPFNFSEFCLNDVKMTVNASRMLVESLIRAEGQKPVTVQYLQLANCNLQGGQIEGLARSLLEDHSYIEKLDLSLAKAQRSAWSAFFDIIKDTTRLRTLRVSGNLLLEEGKETETLGNIKHFIKYNSSLQHLDFSYCGLTNPQLKFICKQLKKSGCLQGVHLCLNPGLDSDFVEWCCDKFKSQPVQATRHKLAPY